MFIPSVQSALEALLKGPTWLLWKVVSIFFSRRGSPPPPIPSSDLRSVSDSPYETTHQESYSLSDSQYERVHSQQQGSYHPYPPLARPAAKYSQPPSAHQSPSQQRSYHPDPKPRPTAEYSQSPSAHQSSSQQRSYRPDPPPRPAAEYSQSPSAHQSPSQQRPYHPDPPPRPAAEYSQSPSAHQSPSQQSPHQPRRKPSVRFPTTPASFVPPDVAPVISHTPQRSRRISGPELATRAPEVAVTPIRSRRISGPELATRAPEVAVTPIVIDPHEDPESLRLKARNEGGRMEECFKQSREAFARNERGLAKQLSLRGGAHKDNMVRLDKEASTKIFQENNPVCGCSSEERRCPTLFRKCRFNVVDLHGLYVEEAKLYFHDAIRGVRDLGESSIRVIVGKGNHSLNNIPRVKPAIQEYGESLGLGVEVDPHNDGCFVVSLNPS
ncbi:hypothetical protein EDB19DRAFT_2035542 [Suillus lakei]|nr:hypothetical protein EDB19DRAFT_2035542 [Suillus lakei]